MRGVVLNEVYIRITHPVSDLTPAIFNLWLRVVLQFIVRHACEERPNEMEWDVNCRREVAGV